MANPENKIEKDTQSEIQKENKMGVMPVGKLLFTMSLPIMISMLVQALYNVVDSMFVARSKRKRADRAEHRVPDSEPDDRGVCRSRRRLERGRHPVRWAQRTRRASTAQRRTASC